MLTSDGASLGFRKPLDKIREAEKAGGEELAERDPGADRLQGMGREGRQRRQAGGERERGSGIWTRREDVQGRQRYQDTPGACGREKGRPEAPGKGGRESPRENLSRHRLMQLALSQRVSGKWFPLAGGQGGSFMEGGQGGEPERPESGH